MKKVTKILLCCLAIIIFATGCGKKKEKVIIYTSTEEFRNKEMIKQLNEKFPNYEIDVQHIATGNCAAKIKAEGKNIEADIILGLELSHIENLKDSFAKLDKFDTSNFVDGINPDHNKYIIWDKYTASIIVDKDYFKKHNFKEIKTYNDLLNPKFKGLIAMPDPKTSGTGYMYYLNVVNEMGEKKGLEYFDKLSKNVKQFTTSGSGPVSLLKQGEIAIAMGMTFHGINEIDAGANYKIIELDTGTPYNMTGIGIIAGKDEKQAVKEVFEWLITDWTKYDKEHFVPGKVLKDQETKIKNYPVLKDANMKSIEDSKKKDDLIAKWKF